MEVISFLEWKLFIVRCGFFFSSPANVICLALFQRPSHFYILALMDWFTFNIRHATGHDLKTTRRALNETQLCNLMTCFRGTDHKDKKTTYRSCPSYLSCQYCNYHFLKKQTNKKHVVDLYHIVFIHSGF